MPTAFVQGVGRSGPGGRRIARVPILMYHYISVPPEGADGIRYNLSVWPEVFATQMAYLAVEGYHPIRLADLAHHLADGTPLPDKPVVLTFDDGYEDNYASALPVLRASGFPATFFVITRFVDDGRPGYMTWDQLREMAAAGMEIGSHALDHPDLRGKAPAYQFGEVAAARLAILTQVGQPAETFCYPSGQYDAATLDALRASGYLAAVTEIPGVDQSGDQLMELRRLRVQGSRSIHEFAAMMRRYSVPP
jgi:peptidoglycan/xylan/chitin deacetylase (PgdA/CDA1 family)